MSEASFFLGDKFSEIDIQNFAFTVWKCSCGKEILVLPIAHFGDVIALPHCLKCDNSNIDDMEFIRRWTQEEIDDMLKRIDDYNNK